MSRWQRIRAMPARAGRSIVKGFKAAGSGVVAVASIFDFADVMLFGGCALIGYGLYQVYQPAAFFVPGAIFVAVAVKGAGGGAE